VRSCSAVELRNIAGRACAALGGQHLLEFALELGLTTESLQRLGIGWLGKEELEHHGFRHAREAWSFPMRDATGSIVGIRLRLPNGRKLAITGSNNGLFIPSDLPAHSHQLLIAEGESDCAALLDLGFEAIGRPGCENGTRLLIRLVTRIRPTEIVIVSDGDEPGLRGADKLAAAMRVFCSSVRVIAPPPGVKDARVWKRHGATHDEIAAAIELAQPVGLELVSARHGGDQ
jgi:DNA primase